MKTTDHQKSNDQVKHQESFRTWKSGKIWLFAGAALVTLALGTAAVSATATNLTTTSSATNLKEVQATANSDQAAALSNATQTSGAYKLTVDSSALASAVSVAQSDGVLVMPTAPKDLGALSGASSISAAESSVASDYSSEASSLVTKASSYAKAEKTWKSDTAVLKSEEAQLSNAISSAVSAGVVLSEISEGSMTFGTKEASYASSVEANTTSQIASLNNAIVSQLSQTLSYASAVASANTENSSIAASYVTAVSSYNAVVASNKAYNSSVAASYAAAASSYTSLAESANKANASNAASYTSAANSYQAALSSVTAYNNSVAASYATALSSYNSAVSSTNSYNDSISTSYASAMTTYNKAMKSANSIADTLATAVGNAEDDGVTVTQNSSATSMTWDQINSLYTSEASAVNKADSLQNSMQSSYAAAVSTVNVENKSLAKMMNSAVAAGTNKMSSVADSMDDVFGAASNNGLTVNEADSQVAVSYASAADNTSAAVSSANSYNLSLYSSAENSVNSVMTSEASQASSVNASYTSAEKSYSSGMSAFNKSMATSGAINNLLSSAAVPTFTSISYSINGGSYVSVPFTANAYVNFPVTAGDDVKVVVSGINGLNMPDNQPVSQITYDNTIGSNIFQYTIMLTDLALNPNKQVWMGDGYQFDSFAYDLNNHNNGTYGVNTKITFQDGLGNNIPIGKNNFFLFTSLDQSLGNNGGTATEQAVVNDPVKWVQTDDPVTGTGNTVQYNSALGAPNPGYYDMTGAGFVSSTDGYSLNFTQNDVLTGFTDATTNLMYPSNGYGYNFVWSDLNEPDAPSIQEAKYTVLPPVAQTVGLPDTPANESTSYHLASYPDAPNPVTLKDYPTPPDEGTLKNDPTVPTKTPDITIGNLPTEASFKQDPPAPTKQPDVSVTPPDSVSSNYQFFLLPPAPTALSLSYTTDSLSAELDTQKTEELADGTVIGSSSSVPLVAKGNTLDYQLSADSLPADRAASTKTTYTDPLPQGYAPDLSAIQSDNTAYSESYDSATNTLTFTATDSTLAAENAGLGSAYSLPAIKVEGTTENDNGDYQNNFTLEVDTALGDYTSTSNIVKATTPGGTNPDDPNGTPIAPTKAVEDSAGNNIDEKTVKAGDKIKYVLTDDNAPFKGISYTDDEEKENSILYVDDIPDNDVTVDTKDATAIDANGKAVGDVTAIDYKSLSDAPQAVQDALKQANLNPKGEFVLWTTSDPDSFTKDYIEAGDNVTLTLPATVTSALNKAGGTIDNTADQLTFGNGYATNEVKNSVVKVPVKTSKPTPKKSSLPDTGDVVKGGLTMIGLAMIAFVAWLKRKSLMKLFKK